MVAPFSATRTNEVDLSPELCPIPINNEFRLSRKDETLLVFLPHYESNGSLSVSLKFCHLSHRLS